MPRPGPRRPLVCFRLSEAEVEQLDQLAEQHQVTRSDVIREFVQAGLESGNVLRRSAGIATQIIKSWDPVSPSEH